MRPLVARGAADVAQDLALEDSLPLGHRGVVQIPIEAVVAATVVDEDRGEIGAEGTGEAHAAGGDGAHRRARRSGDADPVPGQAGVVGAGGGAEAVENPPVDRPVELTQVGGGNGG